MKNKLLIFLMCAMFVFSAAVNAAAGDITAQITDGVNGVVKVSGTSPVGEAGGRVNILVLPEGTTPGQAAANPAALIEYQDSAVTEDGGKFSKEFTLYFETDAEEECALTVYVGGDGFTPETIAELPLYYASMGLKIEKADEICKAEVSGTDELLPDCEKVFALESELYKSLDKEKFSEFFKNQLKVNSVEFKENTDGNLDYNTDMYSKFEELLKYSVAMEAFNQNKKSYIIKDGSIEYDEMLGITKYLDDHGTLSKLYTESLTASGVSAAVDGLFGNNAQSSEDLQKIFAKQVILNGIKNNTKNGSGIVASVLTDDNIKAAGLALPNYTSLSSTSVADDAIYSIRNEITLSNMESKIEECSKVKSDISKPSASPSGNNSGKKTGSISVGQGTVTTPMPEVNTAAFSDIDGYVWAQESIGYLSGRNILNGVGDGLFNPGGELTREAAAKIICLAFGIAQSNEENIFTDVDSSAWYAPYVTALNKLSVIKGISETEFGLGAGITREDFAVMIYRALNWEASSAESAFSDSDSISSYALDAVNTLYEKGIINGYQDGSYGPKLNISRAEGAKIIYSVLMSE